MELVRKPDERIVTELAARVSALEVRLDKAEREIRSLRDGAESKERQLMEALESQGTY